MGCLHSNNVATLRFLQLRGREMAMLHRAVHNWRNPSTLAATAAAATAAQKGCRSLASLVVAEHANDYLLAPTAHAISAAAALPGQVCVELVPRCASSSRSAHRNLERSVSLHIVFSLSRIAAFVNRLHLISWLAYQASLSSLLREDKSAA